MSGTASFFIIRNKIRDRHHGDSIIAYVNSAYDSSIYYFDKDLYSAASVNFRKAIKYEKEYQKYRVKRHIPQSFSFDSLKGAALSCDFLGWYSGENH